MNRFVIALATLAYLVPHPFGVSPIGATALYAGAHGARYFWATPLIPLTVGALVFGFYEPLVMSFVFAGFMLSTLAGRWLLRRSPGYGRYAAAVATGAGIFYVVSNFAIWLVGYYPPTVAGLVQCYLNGLPFLGQAMLADAAYCFVLFGLHQVFERRQAAPVHV
jgi:hypothetical protein